MFGHSLGGATAGTATVNDTRIKGGLDMDGAIFGDVLEEGLDRPFLLVTAETWAQLWSMLSGWNELESAGSLHYTFSDFPSQLETLGIKLNATELVELLSGGDGFLEPDAVAVAASLLKAGGGIACCSRVCCVLGVCVEGKERGAAFQAQWQVS